jgi:hypothetical protein
LTTLLLILASCLLSALAWLYGDTSSFNADGLLAVAWIHDAIHFPASIFTFQLARIPSLIPDLAVFGVFSLVFSDFRWALFSYSVFQCAAILILSTKIVSQVTWRSLGQGAVAISITFVVVVMSSLYEPYYFAHHTIFRIMEHSGSFVMTLLSTALFLNLIKKSDTRRWIALFLISTASVLSNKMFLLTFIIPSIAAASDLVARGHLPRRFVLTVGMNGAIALVAGVLLTLLLSTETTPPVLRLLVHFREFILQLSAYFYTNAWPYVPLFLLPLAFFLLLPKVIPDWFSHPKARAVWIIACVGSLLSLAFCASFFVDVYSIRYLVAAFFWPIIFLAIPILRYAPERLIIWLRLGAVAIYVGIATGLTSKAASYSGWHSPLAECLLQKQAELGLKDGFAGYWEARPAVIGSGWKLQIEQMGGGKFYHWGNNPYWLTHSIRDPNKPPQFNFIVHGQFNRAEDIVARFGEPARRSSCIGHQIWVYDDLIKIDLNSNDWLP